MKLSLYRVITRISVRTRIILLAAIPVGGFLVNGIAFTAGEREVESAFRTADRASDLAELVRALEHFEGRRGVLGAAAADIAFD